MPDRVAESAAASAAPAHAELMMCFIVGSTRSGTTLLSVLLGRHSKVVATPETELLPHLWFAGRLDEHGPRRLTHEAVLADARLHCEPLDDLDLDWTALLARYHRAEPTHRELYRALLAEYAAVRGGAVVVDGTPTNLAFVPLLRSWFPDARFVAMVRDGRDRVESLVQEPWAGNHRTYYSALWAQDAGRIAELRRDLADTLVVLRYEDLVADASSQVQRVVHALGLEVEPAQLQPEVAAGAHPSTAIPARLAATKLREVGPVDTESVGRWRRHATPAGEERMTALMGRWLRYWGYPLPDRPPRGRLLFWWTRAWTWPLRAMPYGGMMRLVRARRRLRMRLGNARAWLTSTRRSAAGLARRSKR